ncbi:MAG: chemotaxis protein CheW [Gammaproteobacteria bacterium]
MSTTARAASACASANGWLMHPLGTDLVAIGEFELAHVMSEAPELFAVPGAPAYCRQAIIWNARPVPVLDLATRVYEPRALLAATRTRELAHAYIAVVRYSDPAGDAGVVDGAPPLAGAVAYGAFALRALPGRVEVSDDQTASLSDDQAGWSPYVLSCFEHVDGALVPILHLERVFSAALD